MECWLGFIRPWRRQKSKTHIIWGREYKDRYEGITSMIYRDNILISPSSWVGKCSHGEPVYFHEGGVDFHSNLTRSWRVRCAQSYGNDFIMKIAYFAPFPTKPSYLKVQVNLRIKNTRRSAQPLWKSRTYRRSLTDLLSTDISKLLVRHRLPTA